MNIDIVQYHWDCFFHDGRKKIDAQSEEVDEIQFHSHYSAILNESTVARL